MKEIIKLKVLEFKDNIIHSVSESVKIPSETPDKSENYPFNKNISDCIIYVLNLCKSFGFNVFYQEGYYAYAEIGNGDELIGIVGELNVAPAGNLDNWTLPPFTPSVSDGKIYGRGIQYNKAPIIASIYALKSLIDSNITLRKRYRIIFEINKYLEFGEEIPILNFIPNSKFPLLNIDKGILQVELISNKPSDVYLKENNTFDYVPNTAYYTGNHFSSLKNELDRLEFDYNMELDKLYVNGIKTHSLICDTGINAISRICIALNNLGVESESIKFIASVIGEDVYANAIVPSSSDEIYGNLTFNISGIDLSSERQIISLDIRIPATLKKEDIISPLIKHANKYNLEYNEINWTKSKYDINRNSLINTLRNIYKNETTLNPSMFISNDSPHTLKIYDNISYKVIFSQSIESIYQANEYISVIELIKATQIYALSIFELNK